MAEKRGNSHLWDEGPVRSEGRMASGPGWLETCHSRPSHLSCCSPGWTLQEHLPLCRPSSPMAWETAPPTPGAPRVVEGAASTSPGDWGMQVLCPSPTPEFGTLRAGPASAALFLEAGHRNSMEALPHPLNQPGFPSPCLGFPLLIVGKADRDLLVTSRIFGHFLISSF